MSCYWSPYWIYTQHPTCQWSLTSWSYLILRAIPAIHEIYALREVFWQRVGKFLFKSIIALCSSTWNILGHFRATLGHFGDECGALWCQWRHFCPNSWGIWSKIWGTLPELGGMAPLPPYCISPSIILFIWCSTWYILRHLVYSKHWRTLMVGFWSSLLWKHTLMPNDAWVN